LQYFPEKIGAVVAQKSFLSVATDNVGRAFGYEIAKTAFYHDYARLFERFIRADNGIYVYFDRCGIFARGWDTPSFLVFSGKNFVRKPVGNLQKYCPVFLEIHRLKFFG
jgi:hypothetical protein